MDQHGDGESSWMDAMGSDWSEDWMSEWSFLVVHDDCGMEDGNGEECCSEG